MKILVCGGAGYIGSHTCIELIKAGYEVVIVDNFYNAKEKVIARIEMITKQKIKYYREDCASYSGMKKIIEENRDLAGIINFAGYKAVGESCKKPLMYYKNNLNVNLNLLTLMIEYQINDIVFSSSATVYGNSSAYPFVETANTERATNPYGTTKVVSEYIFSDVAKANPQLNISILRYFNPIGAHQSGLIGEDPNGIPNNLLPYITQVAIKKLPKLTIFGDDYDTADGTCVRDYIHVVDLGRAHVKALEYLRTNPHYCVHNIGTGQGVSVLKMVKTFEKVNKVNIPYVIGPRRAGDIAISYAAIDKAKKELGFVTKYTLEDMCRDSWNWQQKNPNGIE